jgi:hypothetical protein
VFALEISVAGTSLPSQLSLRVFPPRLAVLALNNDQNDAAESAYPVSHSNHGLFIETKHSPNGGWEMPRPCPGVNEKGPQDRSADQGKYAAI